MDLISNNEIYKHKKSFLPLPKPSMTPSAGSPEEGRKHRYNLSELFTRTLDETFKEMKIKSKKRLERRGNVFLPGTNVLSMDDHNKAMTAL